MTYTLYVGDYTYSSWSLRGWLAMDPFGIARRIRYAAMRTDAFETLKTEIAPGRLVPALGLPDGQIVFDTLAIAETLAERHPDAGHWPADPGARALARSLVATMHSGFSALRGACPMHMAAAYEGFEPSAEVLADLAHLRQLWAAARAHPSRADGPFLFGPFTLADAFFAPVSSRIATYGLPLDGADSDYIAAVLGHPSVRRWRAMGRARQEYQAHYDMDLPSRPNPHEPALIGRLSPGGRAENARCPYSNDPVDPACVVEITDGAGRLRMIGYCNPFCAAKTAADPLAWPQTVALLEAEPVLSA